MPVGISDIENYGDDAYWHHRFFCDFKYEEEDGGKYDVFHQIADKPEYEIACWKLNVGEGVSKHGRASVPDRVVGKEESVWLAERVGRKA